MDEIVVIGAARTPVGTSFKGSLVDTSAEHLAATVLKALVERAGLQPDDVGDVILAESLYGGGAVARYAALEAGLTRAGGMALNRHCAGSLTAVGLGAATILAGMEDVVLVGGVQATSMSPRMQYRPSGRAEFVENWMPPTHPDSAEAPNRDMSITVGWNAALSGGITREEMDAWALRSHERAIAAIDAGHFEEEIVPVSLPSGGLFAIDEHPRRGSTLEKLGSLKPLHPEIDGFSITAGNSSGINDAASGLALTSGAFAAAHGKKPLARILGWAAAGVEPRDTGLAAITVIEKLLARSGRSAKDIALWEINEAFASVPILACRRLGLDEGRVNVSGSGCSIGHPVAASGGRMINTLIRSLKRRGSGLGIAAMCAGGGQGGAILIEA